MLGTIATFYDTEAVLIAVGITAAVTLALTLFAFQTKIDFTGCGGTYVFTKKKILKFILTIILKPSHLLFYLSLAAVLLCILVIFVFSGMLLGIFSAMGRMG